MIRALVIFVSAWFAPLLASADIVPRVLIVDGFSNHDWRRTTVALVEILESAGIKNVDVSTAPGGEADAWGQWRPRFSDYDVVIQTCNSLGGRGDWPDAVKAEFVKYVREGGGVVMHHAANNSFEQWPEYNLMIGLGWRKKDFGKAIMIGEGGAIIEIPAGEGGNTGHGPRIDTLIERVADHELTTNRAGEERALDVEVYRYARGPAVNLTVLTCAVEPKTGLKFPIEWIVKCGEGEVYTSTFGHFWHDQEDVPPGILCPVARRALVDAVRYLAAR